MQEEQSIIACTKNPFDEHKKKTVYSCMKE